MLSKVVLTEQRFILIIDELNREKLAGKLLCKWLWEQNHNMSNIKTLKLSTDLNDERTYEAFVEECRELDYSKSWNVLLPPLSDLLCYQRPAIFFQLIHKLISINNVSRIFLWASTHNLSDTATHVLLPYFESMSDLVLRFQSPTELSIVRRKPIVRSKPIGAVVHERYNYHITSDHKISVKLVKETKKETSEPREQPAQLGTFKIDLKEDEMVARNALKLPYEKTYESTEGNIIYTPDSENDFDDEDPDEDLRI